MVADNCVFKADGVLYTDDLKGEQRTVHHLYSVGYMWYFKSHLQKESFVSEIDNKNWHKNWQNWQNWQNW